MTPDATTLRNGKTQRDLVLSLLLGVKQAPPADVPEDVVIRRGGLIPVVGGWLSGSRGRAGAVTLGRTIIVHPDEPLTPRLLQHELEHVAQWRRAPVTFPLRYVWQHMRHGYRDNPYEVAARAAERTERSPGDRA